MSLITKAKLMGNLCQVCPAVLADVVDGSFHPQDALVLLGCHFHPVFEKPLHMPLADADLFVKHPRCCVFVEAFQGLLQRPGDGLCETEMPAQPSLQCVHPAYVVMV